MILFDDNERYNANGDWLHAQMQPFVQEAFRKEFLRGETRRRAMAKIALELPAAVVELAPGANIYDVQSIWAGSVMDSGLFLLL
jgi:hypothetical protein